VLNKLCEFYDVQLMQTAGRLFVGLETKLKETKLKKKYVIQLN